MTLIERRECPEHGSANITTVLSHADPTYAGECYCGICGEVAVRVGYVPASQLQGAVSLLDELADVLADVSVGLVEREDDRVMDALQRVAAHAAARGQSEGPAEEQPSSTASQVEGARELGWALEQAARDGQSGA